MLFQHAFVLLILVLHMKVVCMKSDTKRSRHHIPQRAVCVVLCSSFLLPVSAQTSTATVTGGVIAPPPSVAPPQIDYLVSLQNFSTRLNVTANAGGGGTLQQTTNEVDFGIWRMEPAAGGAWCLVNWKTNTFLIDSATVASGAPTCTQQWRIEPHAARPGFNKLRNAQTNRYLQVRAQQTGVSPVFVQAASGADTELWRVVGRPHSGATLFSGNSQNTLHYLSNAQFGGFLARRGTQPVVVSAQQDNFGAGVDTVLLEPEAVWSLSRLSTNPIKPGHWCIFAGAPQTVYLGSTGVTTNQDCWVLESTWGLAPSGRPGAAVLQLRHLATGQYLKQAAGGQIGLGPWTAGNDAHWSINITQLLQAPSAAIGVLANNSSARSALLHNMSLPVNEAFYNAFIPRAAARYLRDRLKRQPTQAEIDALLNKVQDTTTPGPLAPIVLGMKGVILDLIRSRPEQWTAQERELLLHVQAKLQQHNNQYADRMWSAWQAYKAGPKRSPGTSFAPVFALNTVDPSNFVLPTPYVLNPSQQARLQSYLKAAEEAGPLALAVSSGATLAAGVAALGAAVGISTGVATAAVATLNTALVAQGLAPVTVASIYGSKIGALGATGTASGIAAPAFAVIASVVIISYSAYQISEIVAYEKKLKEEISLQRQPVDLYRAAKSDEGYELLAVFLDYLLVSGAPWVKSCSVQQSVCTDVKTTLTN